MSGQTALDGMRLTMVGRLREAADVYTDILKNEPENFDALHGLALVRSQQGELEPAESLLAKALSLRPRSAELLYNRGSLLQKLGRKQDALACFDAALSIRGDNPETLGNRGALLMDLGRHQDAFADFTRVTIAKPALPEAWSNQGAALIKLKRYREALACYGKAISLKPDFLEARRIRAWLAFSLRQFAEALSDTAWILARDADDVLAWQLRGDILAATGRHETAVESYGRAISLRPEGADALFNRANNLFGLRRFEEAARDYAAVVQLDRKYRYALGHLVFAKLCCCDWPGLDELQAELRAGLSTRTMAVQPFHALVSAGSEAAIFTATKAFGLSEYPTTAVPLSVRAAYDYDRIRIGYLSASFHNHAVSRLMAGVFEHHDPTRFEITAFSLGADDGGALRQRLMPAVDEFLDLSNWDDQRVAKEIRRRQIDIAVDLMGFTENSRPAILAQRPAPIQINFLGYAGSMAADHIDYLIGDAVVTPPESDMHYSERIVRLPHCYLPQDSTRAIADVVSRTGAGLPEEGFVFCCFNHSYKIRPEIFDVWMRLLRGVPGSVLWLNQLDPTAQRNLRTEAQSRQVEAQRIVFAPFVADDAEHLARLRAASLFLDTPGYNAHATACDALWAGVPVVTVVGQTFPGRVGASLLHSLGMDELVAPDLVAYEKLALELAGDAGRLGRIRRKLSDNRATCALFDTGRFTRNLEAAYGIIRERSRAGLPPATFSVPTE